MNSAFRTNDYPIKTLEQLREQFWESHPEYQDERRYRKRQNDYRADIRMAWVQFVDHCKRDHIINEKLAKRATL